MLRRGERIEVIIQKVLFLENTQKGISGPNDKKIRTKTVMFRFRDSAIVLIVLEGSSGQ